MDVSMDMKQNNLLTSNEITYILIGAYVEIGIFSLPNSLVKAAGQDAWISVLLGAVYPLYVIFIANIFIRKYPDENILILSKKYMGKFIGSIMNFIFALMFLFILTAIISGTANLMRVYVISFITPIKVITMSAAVSCYAALKGLKPLGRMTMYLFYLMIALMLTSFSALKYGSFSNLQPLFGMGIKGILAGAKATIYQYSTIEVLFLIYPYAKDKGQAVVSGLKATGIVVMLYMWTVFITIYYLGIDIIPKNYWSFVMIGESVQIDIINNFRFIFLFFWIQIAFKVMSVEYYAASFILSDLLKIKRKTICFLIFPFVVFFSLQYKNEVIRRQILDMTLGKVILFNLIYVTIIAALMLIKGRTEKNKADEEPN